MDPRIVLEFRSPRDHRPGRIWPQGDAQNSRAADGPTDVTGQQRGGIHVDKHGPPEAKCRFFVHSPQEAAMNTTVTATLSAPAIRAA